MSSNGSVTKFDGFKESVIEQWQFVSCVFLHACVLCVHD